MRSLEDIPLNLIRRAVQGYIDTGSAESVDTAGYLRDNLVGEALRHPPSELRLGGAPTETHAAALVAYSALQLHRLTSDDIRARKRELADLGRSLVDAHTLSLGRLAKAEKALDEAEYPEDTAHFQTIVAREQGNLGAIEALREHIGTEGDALAAGLPPDRVRIGFGG